MTRAEKRKYHYIYKTTCIVSGRFYIGMHSTDSLDDKYIGSGMLLWKSIHKHGKENHVAEILEFLSSRETLKLREAEIINQELLGNVLCMNLRLGGEGGWDHVHANRKDPIHAKKIAEKISMTKIKNRRDPEKRKELSKNLSNGLKRAFKDEPSKNGMLGKKHSDETKTRMSAIKKGTCLGVNNSQYGTRWVYLEDIAKKIDDSEFDNYLSIGWKPGKKAPVEIILNELSPCFGRKWISKELKNKRVKPSELETYLANGWTLGRI